MKYDIKEGKIAIRPDNEGEVVNVLKKFIELGLEFESSLEPNQNKYGRMSGGTHYYYNKECSEINYHAKLIAEARTETTISGKEYLDSFKEVKDYSDCKISELPEDVKVIAEKRLKEYDSNLSIHSCNIHEFVWERTPEGHDVWNQARQGNFEPLREFHKGNVSSPESGEVTKFVKGEYYVILTMDSTNYIIKASQSGNNSGSGIAVVDNKTGGNIHRASGGWGLGYPVRKATPEERCWLDACIAADEFVPKDQLPKWHPDGVPDVGKPMGGLKPEDMVEGE